MGAKPRAPLPAATEVYIRHPEAGDEAALLELEESSRLLHRPWVRPPATTEEFATYLTRVNTIEARGYFVFRRADGALVGVFNVSEIVRGPLQSAFLGYYGASRWAGRGYMSQGLGLVLDHVFVHLKLHRLEANIQPDNARSRALASRCGFRLEGFSPRYLFLEGAWRDHERWAITLEDWRARRWGV